MVDIYGPFAVKVQEAGVGWSKCVDGPDEACGLQFSQRLNKSHLRKTVYSATKLWPCDHWNWKHKTAYHCADIKHTICHQICSDLDCHDGAAPCMYHSVDSTISTAAYLTFIHQIISREVKRLQQIKSHLMQSNLKQAADGLWHSAGFNMPIHAHFFRRAILTRKVGHIDLVIGVQSGFISRSVHAKLQVPCIHPFIMYCSHKKLQLDTQTIKLTKKLSPADAICATRRCSH